MRTLRHMLDKIGAPAFRTPETADNAFGILASYHYNQTLSQQILPPEPLARQVDLGRVRALIDRVRNAGRTELTPDESEALFACFHIFVAPIPAPADQRSEEHTSELQSLMRISYAVFCLKNKKNTLNTQSSTIAYEPAYT